VRGFLAEVVQRIGSPELEERLIGSIAASLEHASVTGAAA